MKPAKALAFLGALAMGASLIYGFVAGSFSEEGKTLTSLPWGRVSLVDVYVGFSLFSGWIFFREKSVPKAAAWTISVMILGNFAASIYALLALWRSHGDWKRFWLGQRRDDAARYGIGSHKSHPEG